MSDDHKVGLWAIGLMALLVVAALFTTRSCSEAHARKIRIEYMPEDAAAVRDLLRGAK